MKNEANLLNDSINDGFKRPSHAVVFEGGANVINACEADCLYSAFWMGSEDKMNQFYEDLVVSVEKDVSVMEKDEEFKEDTVCAKWLGQFGLTVVGVITSREELSGINSLLDRAHDNRDIIRVASFEIEQSPWTIWDNVNKQGLNQEWKQSVVALFSEQELNRLKQNDMLSIEELQIA